MLDVEETTRRTYEGYISRHIRPALLGQLDGEVFDSFYAHCDGAESAVAARPASSTTGRSGRMSATTDAIHTAAGR